MADTSHDPPVRPRTADHAARFVTPARGDAGRPIRVLHVIANLDVGGAQEVVRSLVPRLKSEGCDPLVVALRDGPLRSDLERAGVPVRIVQGRRRSLAGDPRAITELLRIRSELAGIVRNQRVDVIQSHLLRSLDFLLLTLPRRSGTPRVVWTFHNARLDLRSDQLPRARWLLGLKRRAYRFLYRAASRRVAAMVAVSADVAAAIQRDFRPVRGRLVTIANGVDLDRYGHGNRRQKRQSLGIPTGGPLAICVAKFSEQKGHRVLIDALTRGAGRAANLQLALVGTGPLHDAIASHVAQAGLADRVHLLGERRDVSDLLLASDLFVLPSLWEGLPMALLEAMAAGLPVIATAVSGTRDVVAGSESGGILVTAGDVEELCGALDRLASDAALRRSLGKAARRRVADHFSVAVQARAHADLYRALMHAQPLAQPGVLP